MVTRLGLYGAARSPYGSFSSKGAGTTKSYSIDFTRLGLYGAARSPYGSFAGKIPVAPDSGIVTRLGLYGGARSPYGSFVGRPPQAPPEEIPKFEGLRQNVGRMMR
jgi:hypothetical protein